jgi:hypothetical protein
MPVSDPWLFGIPLDAGGRGSPPGLSRLMSEAASAIPRLRGSTEEARTPLGKFAVEDPSRSVRAVVADVGRRLVEGLTAKPQLSIGVSACSNRDRCRRQEEYDDHSTDRRRGRRFVVGQHNAPPCTLGFEGVVIDLPMATVMPQDSPHHIWRG